jgi:type VI secretion system protein ImpM
MGGRFEVGFYGKLPSHGDFLRRRVSEPFVDAWDPWLQEALEASREMLGDRWLDTYLTSPAWRFAAAPGAIGPSGVAGVMVPSVDRVGRYFYVTIVTELPLEVWPGDAATRASDFFQQAEDAAIEAVSAEQLDLDLFDRQVHELVDLLDVLTVPPGVLLDERAGQVLETKAAAQWLLPLGSPPQLGDTLLQLLWARLATAHPMMVLWWTGGSSLVEPSSLITSGLPDVETFAALLDGNWAPRRWLPVPARLRASAVESDALVDDLTPPLLRSAGATNVGRVRTVNQDAFLERPDAGIWVVADGVGGLSDGEVASRMVCDALVDFSPAGSFEEMIGSAGLRLQEVNAHLARVTDQADESHRSGSTVVALLARGSRCAVLWAGDSRLYRWRNGSLDQLTRDHSLSVDGEATTAITRAIGGDSRLTLDVVRERVQPGDRFLLCSDGLTRAVPEPVIGQLVRQGDVGEAVAGLIRATLDAGAPDNVTALIVEAYL